MNKAIIYIIVTAAIISSVFGIGLSPAEKYISWNTTKITLRLINNERKNTTATISIEGDLAKYIKTKNKTVSFSEKEFIKKIYLYASFPKDLEPREKEIRVIAIENKKPGSQINAVPASTSRIMVLVPYKGSMIKGKMLFDAKTNTISIILFNFGEKKADAEMKLSADGNTLKKIKFSIESQKQKQFLFHLNKLNIKNGYYDVKAEIKYGKKKLELKTRIIYGLPEIKISNINLKHFQLHGINKIWLGLYTEWNRRFNITACIKIKNTTSEKKTTEIYPKKGGMDIIIDMKNISPGNYTAQVCLEYYNYSEKRNKEIIVGKGSAYFYEYRRKEKGSILAFMAVLAIIAVVAIDILYIIKRRKKR